MSAGTIVEAKQTLPLPALMELLALGEHAKRSARCPFHEDHANSFSMFQGENGWHWKCYAGCGTGDEIDLVARVESLSNADAVKRYLTLAGAGPNGAISKSAENPRESPPHSVPACINWDECCHVFTDKRAEQFRAWRGYPDTLVQWMRQNRLIGLYRGLVALPVHGDDSEAVAAHYRLKDGTWRYAPVGSKVRPLILGDIATASEVHIFESPWDGLAVWGAFLDCDLTGVAFLITRGAGNGALVARLTERVENIFAWPQNDPEAKRKQASGLTPAEEWLNDVIEYAARQVLVVRTPATHKDPNDWLRAGAGTDNFFAAIKDAIAAAVVLPKLAPAPVSHIKAPSTSMRPEQPAVIAGDAPQQNGQGEPAIGGSDDNLSPGISIAGNAAVLPFEAYYDASRKEYLVCNSGGRWLSHNSAGFKLLLRRHDISTKVPEGSRVSPAEEIIIQIQDTRDVRYAGPLAGRDTGFYDEGGVRFLVTEPPRIVAPVPGSWDNIRALLMALVANDPDHGPRQLAVLFGWLKCAYMALRERKLQPGQALALAGAVDCGKSLCQAIITALLGGRCAKPYRYLSGRTDFNSELFAAEHLALEDEQSTTDLRSRMQLGASIKGIAVNEVHSCHGKNRDAVNLRPFWRLSISLNDEAEALLVLPPITPDIADKLILLHCMRPPAGFPTGTPAQREAYWKMLIDELPAFADHLVQWQIPAELADERFGVSYFHHPDLVSALESLAPETKLLEMIDRELWKTVQSDSWEGTASDLECTLRGEGSMVRHEAQRLLTWTNACGAYLGRLAEKHPGRVTRHRVGQARLWIVHKTQQGSIEPQN